MSENQLLKKFKNLGLNGKDEGYEADAEALQQPKKYKSRLIVGDGNLSYARALLTKHPGIASSVTVTEVATQKGLEAIHAQKELKKPAKYRNFKRNVSVLSKMGSEPRFSVDATQLHTLFSGQRFKRIHFNFPYIPAVGSGGFKQAQEKNRKLVYDFFKSASKIQKPRDRIHLALPKLKNEKKEAWHQEATYAIRSASKEFHYELIFKRKFVDDGKSGRYTGYFHVKTNSSERVNTASSGREFVFEKKEDSEALSPPVKEIKDYAETIKFLSLETDSGSSSYLDFTSNEESSKVRDVR